MYNVHCAINLLYSYTLTVFISNKIDIIMIFRTIIFVDYLPLSQFIATMFVS